jgi:DNA helicase HerA-like ATPase
LEEWAINARSWFKKGYKVIRGDLDMLAKFLSLNFLKSWVIIYVPNTGDEEEELNILSKIVLEAQNGYKMKQHSRKLTFVVDELDLGFPSSRNPMNKYFTEICRRGRHSGINLLGMSQRINQVNITFRSNLSAVFIFRQAEYRDMQAAIQYFGKEWHETIKNLDNYQYICRAGSKISTNFKNT